MAEETYKDFERINDPLYDVIDSDWIGAAFLVDPIDLLPIDRLNRFWSTANLKFTDSSIGGNIAMNPPPQPCRLSDPRVGGRRTGGQRITLAESGSMGMGPWYSEKIDDNSDLLYLQFGIPEFNSLVSFWSRAADYAKAVIVNTGRSPIAYEIGSLIGGAAMFIAFPLVSSLVYGVKMISRLISNTNPFVYYYLKPTMVDFWKSASILATSFAVEGGILHPKFMSEAETADRIGMPVSLDTEDIDAFRKILPDMFTENGNVDLLRLVGRAQGIANIMLRQEREAFDENGRLSEIDFMGYVYQEGVSQKRKGDTSVGIISALNEMLSLSTAIIPRESDPREVKDVSDLEKEQLKDKGDLLYGHIDPQIVTSNGESPVTNKDEISNLKKDGFVSRVTDWAKDWTTGFKSSFDAAVRGGGQYLVLRVDHVGSLTDSGDNSTTEIQAGEWFKNISGASKQLTYSMSGGNIFANEGQLLGYVKDLGTGILDKITFGLASGIAPMLTGGGNVIMPKMYDDSSFSPATTSFTIQCLSPSSDVISKLIHEWLVMAAVMAGSLPREIGGAAYGSPYLCSAFMKGKVNIPLGIIRSFSFTRATANLAYDKLQRAMGIDITIDIEDLSPQMVAPVSAGYISSIFSSLDDFSAANRYISTVCARDLWTNTWSIPRMKMKLSKALLLMDSATSSSYSGMAAGSFLNPLLGGMLHENNLTLLQTNQY